jgi:hypothetical protein
MTDLQSIPRDAASWEVVNSSGGSPSNSASIGGATPIDTMIGYKRSFQIRVFEIIIF